MSLTVLVEDVAEAMKTGITTAVASLTYEGIAPVVYDALPFESAGWDWIALGDFHDGALDPATMANGRMRREADWLQRVHVSCGRPGREARDARVAALNLFEAIDNAIAVDSTFGLATSYPTLRSYISYFRANTVADERSRGWRVSIEIDVRFKARHR